MKKARKKALKAVYLVDQNCNYLNENGVYNFESAKRKAKSYAYWKEKI